MVKWVARPAVATSFRDTALFLIMLALSSHPGELEIRCLRDVLEQSNIEKYFVFAAADLPSICLLLVLSESLLPSALGAGIPTVLLHEDQ